MAYSLGIDLGTTYTAAAIHRGGRLEIADLGTRTSMIPSVVYLREDGAVLTGEAAIRRGVTDPSRLSREFKRRMGDTTAILLGGVPYSVDGLMARMLRAVVDAVTERQGEPPTAIAVAHPANWGQYKKDLLEQAVRRADLDGVTMITEPEAAAVHYAMQASLRSDAIVAVYDLGGGTFDAAVLRKTETGFELIGEPEGIERLGGIDFDEAVFRHVVTSLRGALAELDPDDPVAQAAVSRLRDECVSAKEALSSDTEVSIPVILPNAQTEVRLTRSEFEAMIRPALADTLVVLNRAIRSAAVTADQLHSVLLVGGSSRIPLIAQLVSAELNRPIALDVHPKHCVALGAAAFAAGATQPTQAAIVPPAVAPTAPIPVPVLPLTGGATPSAVASAFPSVPDAPAMLPPNRAVPPATIPPAAAASAIPPATIPPAAVPSSPVPPPPPASATMSPAGAYIAAGPPDGPVGNPKRKGLAIGAGLLAVGALVAIGIVLLGGDDGGQASGGPPASQSDQTVPATNTRSTPGDTEPETTTESETTLESETTIESATSTPVDDPCAGITEPCIVINEVTSNSANTAAQISWVARNFDPDINDLHAHFFWSSYEAFRAGANAPAGLGVNWEISDQPVHTGATELLLANRPSDADGVCATVGAALADPPHSALNPSIFHCLSLPPSS